MNLTQNRNPSDSVGSDFELTAELDTLRRRLMELEEIEVMRITEEQERFDSLQVLDEYAKQLEESRDKLARLLRAGASVQAARTVQEALQKVAIAVGEAGWASVTVTLYEDWNVVQAAYHGVTEEDIAFFRNNPTPPEQRARLFGPEAEPFRVSRSYFIPADRLHELGVGSYTVPGHRPVQPGDTWDPMDLARVPLYGSDGQVMGAINCDDPADGRRPTEATFFYLELFADLAARKVETTRLTERQKQIEEALRQSEEKYRTLFERAGDAYFLLDEIFRDCNSKACELWACERDDIVGHTPWEFSPEFQPDGRRSVESALDRIHRALEGQHQYFYWQHKRKDGVLLDCEVSLSAVEVNDEHLLLAIVRDISQRMRAEQERETLLQILRIAHSTDDEHQMVSGIFEQVGTLLPVENYFLAVYDPRTDMVSFPFYQDEVDPPPPPRKVSGLTGWIVRHRRALRTGRPEILAMAERGEAAIHGTPALSWLGVPLITQSRIIGALVVQSYRTEGLYDENHERTLSVVASQIASVIDRRRSEEALRFTQFSVDHAAEAVFWIGADGRYLYANDNACRALEYTRDELLNMAVAEIEEHIGPDAWAEHWRRVKQEGGMTLQTEHRTRTGRLIPVEVSANYLHLGEREIECAFVRDISERKRAETVQDVLTHIAEAPSVTENLDELLELVRKELGRLVDTTNFYVALYDPETDEYSFPYFVDEEDEPPTGPEELQHSLTDYVRRTGKPILVDDQTHEELSRMGEAQVRGTPSRLWLGVPLKTTHGTIGVVTIQSYHDPCLYTHRDLDLVNFVSGPIAMAIERKRAVDHRRETEERYRKLVELSPDAVLLCQDGMIVYANNRAAQMLRTGSSAELTGRPVLDLVRPDCCAEVDNLLRDAALESSSRPGVEQRLVRGDGTALDVEMAAVSATYKAKPAVQIVLRDVSARKRTADRILKLNQCLLSFGPDPGENINRLVMVCGQLMEATCALYSRLEEDRLHAVGQWQTPPDFPRSDKADGHLCYDVIRRSSDELFVVPNLPETPYYHSDPNVKRYGLQTYIGQAVKCGDRTVGALCVVYQNEVMPTEEARHVMGIVAAAIGVEEVRQRNEAARRHNEEHLRWLLMNLDQAVCTVDAEERITFANHAWAEMLGVPLSKTVGRSLAEFMNAEMFEVVRRNTETRRRGGRNRYHLTVTRPDGGQRNVVVSAIPQMDSEGRLVAVHAALRDVGEETESQEPESG